MRCLLNEVFESGDLLVVVTDPEPDQESQVFIHEALRRAIGETRPVARAPGYAAQWTERERAIAVFASTACFGWKSYLYADHAQMTLYNWEGEIFDFWTSSGSKKNDLTRIIKNFGLQLVVEE